MSLTREAILAAADITLERVAVPEWGGEVFVKPMTALERDRYEADLLYNKGQGPSFDNVRAKLLAHTMCDEAGQLLFTPADVDTLGQKSGAAIQRVYEVARRLSGLTRADVKALEKNSASGPRAASPTGSH